MNLRDEIRRLAVEANELVDLFHKSHKTRCRNMTRCNARASEALILLLAALPAFAQPVSPHHVEALAEQRYCGPPKRSVSGEIIRRADVLAAFRKAHPCPVTGKTTGACPGWSADHIVPIKCEGCDAVSNLQWMPDAIKSCAGIVCKDRWERKIYCTPMQVVK